MTPSSFEALSERLDRFFSAAAPTAPGDAIVVAFSGGPDSTALLAALCRIAPRRALRPIAAHLDHDLVPGSAERAREAAALARALGAPPVLSRQPIADLAAAGESTEEAARRIRYRFLEEVRADHGARWIATGHHRDDQAETVVLRLLQGTGLEGLAGILPRRGEHVVRPFLDVPGEALRRYAEAALPPGHRLVEDPSNRDLRIARNRVRRLLLPRLAAVAEPGGAGSVPDPADRLARLAAAARGARAAIARQLERELGAALHVPADPGAGGPAAALSRTAFEALPRPLVGFALALLQRRAGAPHPAGRAAVDELLRQLAAAESAGVDVGGGWRWETRGESLVLRGPRARRPAARPFSYRLPAPAPGREALGVEVRIGEIGGSVHLRREPVAPWMFRGSRRRAALALPADLLDALSVRSRRPGDRLRPLGAPGERKLKDVLIDRRMPRRDRDRLPLLCVDERIAWVPGVTIDEAFRLPESLRREGGEAWTVELAHGDDDLD